MNLVGNIKHIARILRPIKFSEVIGQVTQVSLIHKALINDLMLPVCILYGPSGVGKTTLARLIAMWQSCGNKINNEPCGICANCICMINGTHPDIYELDGGTYTGVDAIKSMLEGIEYSTILSSKRIYILDEVHMLSKHSISALLKKFEEPLDNLQFILATTNIEKLPDTIISRSFRIPLNSLNNKLIADYLVNIAHKNDIKYEIEAINDIAYMSNGSMRQALSLFEQLTILCSNDIKKSDSLKMLGLSDDKIIEEIIDIISNKTAANLLEYLQSIQKTTNLVQQILVKIQEKIKNGVASEKLIKTGYRLAEASIILHKSPHSECLVEICIANSMLI